MRLFTIALVLFALPLAAELDTGTQFAVAIEDSDVEKVKALLEGGAAADTWIDYGENDITPLMKAANDGEADIVKVLLEAGANVNAQGQGGKETALQNAVGSGHAAIVKLLLDAKADLSLRNTFGFNAFTTAVSAGNREIAESLLAAGAKIDDGAHTLTPLMFAVSARSPEMVKWLASKGANVNAGVKEGGQTALNLAILNADADMVKTLIELKVNVNAKMVDGTTPLKAAQKGDQDDIVALLKAAGAK
jgi:ankyrin repeat protein